LTTYSVEFVPSALREWNKLGSTLRDQFRKKLEERRRHPHVQADRLSGRGPCYKIKLRSAGYRLIYEVEDARLVILVISVGRRERGKAYKLAAERLQKR
jgi:mRNA interferase RelE/StbE